MKTYLNEVYSVFIKMLRCPFYYVIESSLDNGTWAEDPLTESHKSFSDLKRNVNNIRSRLNVNKLVYYHCTPFLYIDGCSSFCFKMLRFYNDQIVRYS